MGFQINIEFNANENFSTHGTSGMNAEVEKLETKYKCNNDSLIKVSFYSKLELYNPTSPVIAHEVDFDAPNREELMDNAFEKLPMGSTLFSAVKDPINKTQVSLSRKDKQPFLFSSGIFGAFGCEPPAGFHIENGKTVRIKA